jgi:RNA polymerase sigma-70 factor (ECF subfamily)
MQANCPLNNHLTTQAKMIRHDTLDVSLVESASKGDDAALRVLFARHKVRVYRFVFRFTGNRSIAEEVVSDVFLDVWRHTARFERKSQVSTWLLGIARKKALATLRRRSELQLVNQRVLLAIEDPADTPEECLHKQDRDTTIQRCLEQLSPAHREIIDLVYYDEKSVDETAEIVGIPSSTVKTRMHYARSRMAKLLERAESDAKRTASPGSSVDSVETTPGNRRKLPC